MIRELTEMNKAKAGDKVSDGVSGVGSVLAGGP
ncbi:hypothetical protein PI124_g11222 [Phytophthora idaei]|nr:hypothetical protein PI125_g17308 [Phytophthora idaei]KAG3243986.1 hypothetical protein PI124_g11222 [Phytophthora idaei]